VSLAEDLFMSASAHTRQDEAVKAEHGLTLATPEAVFMQLNAHLNFLRRVDLTLTPDADVTFGLLNPNK
jgi:hypothetical protein